VDCVWRDADADFFEFGDPWVKARISKTTTARNTTDTAAATIRRRRSRRFASLKRTSALAGSGDVTGRDLWASAVVGIMKLL